MAEALTVHRRTAETWSWRALLVLEVAGCFVAASSSLAFAVLAALGATTAALHPRSRAWLRTRARLRALEERRRRRTMALEDAHGSRDELDELTACVDRLDQLAPGESDRLELEALLDEYVELVAARNIAEYRLARAERFGGEPYGLDASPLGRELDAQQRRTHARVGEHLRGLDDQIANIADLIRLYASRASLPELDYLLAGEELARRVELLVLDETSGGGGS